MDDYPICYLELQSLMSVKSWILSEPFCLFTQVGGFLDLLLGASILTVCEILDFILVAVIAAWNERKIHPELTQVQEVEVGELEDKQKLEENSSITIINIS